MRDILIPGHHGINPETAPARETA